MLHTKWEDTIEWAKVIVGCVIYQNQKYLMVQESQQKAYGLWNVPAGHVDKGESLEVAAVRETKEETGYDAKLLHKLGIYHHAAQASIKHVFIAAITGGSIQPQAGEILQVAWLDFTEIKSLYESDKIRSEWIWIAINDHQKLLKSPTL